MPKFSQRSQRNLDTCHPDIQCICNEVIKIIDFSAICGHRGKEEQNIAFKSKKSTKQFPDSKHNSLPSMALDIVPYPVDWKDKPRFYFLAGHMFAVAHELFSKGKITHKLRWGGDWDNDKDLDDQLFFDLGHFELIKTK